MPAHVGSFSKLRVFAKFLQVNLDPRQKSYHARRLRVATKGARNQLAGTPDAPNNRAAYVGWAKVADDFHRERSRREVLFSNYDEFRGYLDMLDPARRYRPGTAYADPREWDLYLQPGTAFDGLVQQYFAAARGPLMVITHKSEHLKLKRIEALPTGEEPVIIWSDAS